MNLCGLQKLRLWKKEHRTLHSLVKETSCCTYWTKQKCIYYKDIWMHSIRYKESENLISCTEKNLVMYLTVLRFCVSEKASMTAETGSYSSVQVTANKYSPLKTSMFDKHYTWPSIFRSGYDSWNDFRLKVCRMLRYFLRAARNLWLTSCSAFDDTHVDTNLY